MKSQLAVNVTRGAGGNAGRARAPHPRGHAPRRAEDAGDAGDVSPMPHSRGMGNGGMAAALDPHTWLFPRVERRRGDTIRFLGHTSLQQQQLGSLVSCCPVRTLGSSPGCDEHVPKCSTRVDRVGAGATAGAKERGALGTSKRLLPDRRGAWLAGDPVLMGGLWPARRGLTRKSY